MFKVTEYVYALLYLYRVKLAQCVSVRDCERHKPTCSIFVCTYVRSYVHMCVHTYMRMCICAYILMCVCAHVRMCTCAYIHMCVCAHVHTYICAYVHMCVHTYVCMCTCVYIRTYVCAHVRTYIRMGVWVLLCDLEFLFFLSLALWCCFVGIFFPAHYNIIPCTGCLCSGLWLLGSPVYIRSPDTLCVHIIHTYYSVFLLCVLLD